MVSNPVMIPSRVSWTIHACVSAAMFAMLYKYWLTTPVLQYVSIDRWRLIAIVVAAACGVALSLLRVSTLALSCGAMIGLLLGGTLVAWRSTDISISVYDAFAGHLNSFSGEVLTLTLAATLPALCYDYLRTRRTNVQ